MQTKERLSYIDALRGLSMLLVIYSHLALFAYVDIPTPLLVKIGRAFMVPLFFFISGFVLYKKRDWDVRTSYRFILDKIFRIMIPTIIFSAIFNYTYGHGALSYYWFMYNLFEFYVIYCLFSFLLRFFKIARYGNIAFLSLSFLLYFALFSFNGQGVFISVISGNAHHIIYFALGIAAKEFHSRFQAFNSNKFVAFGIIILFIAGIVITDSHTQPNSFVRHFVNLISAISGICLTYSMFSKREEFFKKNAIGKGLTYIGTKTSHIYLIHYFLIPYNSILISNIAMGGGIIELILSIFLIVSISIISILLGRMIDSNEMTAFFLSGKRITKL